MQRARATGSWVATWVATWVAAGLLGLAPVAAPEARAQGDVDLDDIMGGFEDESEEDYFEDVEPEPERWWDLLGSLSLGMSYNYLDHSAQIGPADVTDWGGLSRLRTKGFLQLDVDLPRQWQARASGYGFYDFAYLINGKSMYTEQVVDLYEWDVELQELWVEGPITEQLDLKLGRQVENWGRSDSLRVTDVLNPLDAREPGLTDVSDIRRSLTMVKLDYYVADWSFSGLLIPETRFDQTPPFGSDFFPVFVGLGGPLSEDEPGHWNSHMQFGASATGIFQGWDVSFYAARYWANAGHAEYTTNPPDPLVPLIVRYDRHTMVGAGGNWTVGSWLFKGEVAYIYGFTFTDLTMDPMNPIDRFRKDRFDAMFGVEYYGIDDITVAIELVNRHILFWDERVARAPSPQKENAFEAAFRLTAEFMNDRLSLTLLGVIFDVDASDGSFVRMSGSYDVIDALELTTGIVFFQGGDSAFFGSVDRNDRVFAELKYSF